MSKMHLFFQLICFFLILLNSFCTKKKDNPVSVPLQKTEIIRTTIGSGGGTVTVDNADASVNGMVITIPNGAFSENREFIIADIELPEKGIAGLHPLLAVSIANGGGYSDSLITVTIPAAIGEGNFAMPFMYNEKTGDLEGLPLTALDAHSLTFVTRHFDGSTGSTGLARRMAGSVDLQIVVSSIPFSDLQSIDELLTGFEPGTDDWEFYNYGSLIAPGGHCAGQVLTAMWYYYEMTLSDEPPLYGRYDLSDAVWQDNRFGYRLASVAQQDYVTNNDPALTEYTRRLRDKNLDSIGWYSCIYALKVTRQPQFVGIMREDGGHALIVNGAWPSTGELWITDPNHPGNRSRRITYEEQTFDPYVGAADASESGYEYPFIGYIAKTALVNWKQLGKRWLEFEADTIGRSNFGEMKFFVTANGTKDTLSEIYTCMADTVEITMNTPCEECYLQAVTENGDTIYPHEYTYEQSLRIPLPDSTNFFGIYTVYRLSDTQFEWTDFQWFTIKSIRPHIIRTTPDPVYAESTLTILGEHFGADKDIGIVKLGSAEIPSSAILTWSDTLIRLIVPQDADTGLLTIIIGKVESNPVKVNVLPPRGMVTIKLNETIMDTLRPTFIYSVDGNIEATIYHKTTITGTLQANGLHLNENWRKHGYDYSATIPTRYGQRYTITSAITNPTGKVEGAWQSVNDTLEEKQVVEWSYGTPEYEVTINNTTQYQNLLEYLNHSDTVETADGVLSCRIWVDIPEKERIHKLMTEHQIGYSYERVEVSVRAKTGQTLKTIMVQRKKGTETELPVSESSKTNTQRYELLFTILRFE